MHQSMNLDVFRFNVCSKFMISCIILTSCDLLTSDWTQADTCTHRRCVFGHVNVRGGVEWGNWGGGHVCLMITGFWATVSPVTCISIEIPNVIKYI